MDAELLDDEDLDLFDDLDDLPVEGGPSDGNGNGNGNRLGRCPAPGRRPGTPGGRAVTSGLPVILVLAAAVLVALVRSLRARGASASPERPRRSVALLIVTGLIGASALHRDAGVRAEPRVQGGPRAGPAGDGARGVAGSADPERG